MENNNETEYNKENVDYIQNAKKYIKEVLKEKEEQNLIELEYYKRIYKIAKEICKEEEKSDPFITLLSSLIFDLDNPDLFPNNKEFNNTVIFFDKCNLNYDLRENLLNVIKEILYFNRLNIRPKSLEGKIIEDAIRIDKLSAVGISKLFSENELIYKSKEEEEKELEEKEKKKEEKEKKKEEKKEKEEEEEENNEEKEENDENNEEDEDEQNESSIKILTDYVMNINSQLNTEKAKLMIIKKKEFVLMFLKNFYNEVEDDNKLTTINYLEDELVKVKVNLYSENLKQELNEMIEKEKEKDELREQLKNELETKFERDKLEIIYQRERAEIEKKIKRKRKEIDNKIGNYKSLLLRKNKLNNEV